MKYGEIKKPYTTKNHDHEGALFVKKHGEEFGLDAEAITIITSCIAWHMGRWTDMTGRTVEKSFPGGYNVAQMITHLADVISAQKNVNLSHVD